MAKVFSESLGRTMKTFKDEDGREWESSEIGDKVNSSSEMLLIRPVKQEPKWKIELVRNTYNKTSPQHFVHLSFDADPDQAQLIKAWIESGMKNLNSPMKDFPNEVAETYNAARQSMRENN